MTIVAALTGSGCTQAPATGEPAASTAAAPAAPRVEPAIEQLERDWVAAIVNKDVARLEQLLADDFVGASATGELYTKRLAIEDLQSGQYVVERMDLTDIRVATYDNAANVALAFTTQEESSRYGTADTSGRYTYMDVWVEHDGRWQVIASHGAKAE